MKQDGNLTVYRGWLDPGKHVWSPFVVKIETRLRLAGISYTTEAGSPRDAPKGKIPYITYLIPDTTEPGIKLGDSTLIIKKLVEQGLIPDLNASVSPETAASDLGLRALLEDKLYFYHVSAKFWCL
jgi:hypothetical protein